MSNKLGAIAACFAVAISASFASANNAPKGVNIVPVPANADVLVSVPFNQDAAGDFAVSAVTGTGIQVAGSPFTANQYAALHYVRFTTGNAAGLWTTITANTANELTIADAAVKALVAATDEFTIYPHQTIGTVFPAARKGISFENNTQILLYNNALAVQNKANTGTVTYITGLGWLGEQGNNTILAPETLFVLRNNGGNVLQFVAEGTIPTHPVSYLIPANATKDILVGSGRPVPTSIGKTNFEGVTNRQILLFDNTIAAKNKANTGTVTYITGLGWLGEQGDQTIIDGSEGFIFRQNGGAGGVITTTSPY